MSPLILNTVGIPLAIGLGLGLVIGWQKIPEWLQVLLCGVAVLAVYTLLEGTPAFPPVSAKNRLFFVLFAAIPLCVMAGRMARRDLSRALVPTFLFLALLWLGWNRLMQPVLWPAGLLLFAPIVASVIAQPAADRARNGQAFLWPATLLIYAICASVLSLLGVFVGFAQVLGALAALLGGAFTVLYVRGLISGQPRVVAPPTLWLFMMSLGATALMVGLFAPQVSMVAFALSALILCLPAVAPPLARLPDWLRPFAFGLMAAVPAALSIFAAVMLGH